MHTHTQACAHKPAKDVPMSSIRIKADPSSFWRTGIIGQRMHVFLYFPASDEFIQIDMNKILQTGQQQSNR